jgi:thioredoxin 1
MKFFAKKTKEKLQKNDFPKYIETLDKEKFKNFIESYNICLIDFWASWCQPCKNMSPRIRQLSKRFEGKVAFGKVNIEKNKALAEEYNVMSIPTLLLFINGKEKATLTGLKTVGEIKKIINKYL